MKHTKLTKDNAHLLVHRIKQMLNRKGRVYTQSFYTGTQEIKGYLAQVIPEAEYPLDPVAHSIKDTILNDYRTLVEVDNRPDMQLVRINWRDDHGMAIMYGTKIHMSSSKITWRDKHIVDNMGMTKYITV